LTTVKCPRTEIAREEQKRQQNDQVNTLYEQAHGLLRSKKWRNALDKMAEIRKLDDHFPDADGIAEKAKIELGREEQEAERQNKLAALYAESVRLLKDEKYQEALDKWGEVRAIDPRYPDRQGVGRTARKELAKQTKLISARPKFVMPKYLWIGLGGIAMMTVIIAIIRFGYDGISLLPTPTEILTVNGTDSIIPVPTKLLTEERIVYAGTDESGDQIFLMDPDGGNIQQITFDPGQARRRPSISHNGDKIVFSSGQWGDMNLYLINPDGSNLTNLTELQGDENEPKWSPDDKTIVFSSTRDGNREIYSINVDKTGLTRLTNNSADDGSPYWNPDGSTIVFSSDRDGDFDIYTMKPDGSEIKLLTINNSNDSRPSWSPNGDYIAFNLELDGNNEIYIMKSDGSDQINMTNHPSNDNYPNWSPDGKHIVFFSDREGDGNIWIYSMELSSTLAVRLTSGGSPFWGVVLTDSIEKAPETLTDNLKLPTSVPSPTSLPGKLVLPLESFGKTIPWLPDTAVAVQYVGFNTTRAPFDNPLVRQAFAYAIDRQQIVDMAREYDLGDVELATTLTPPETLGRDLSGEVGISFDPQKAKELLSKAGYSDPSDFPSVTFLVSVSGAVAPGARFNMASAMAEMWKTYLGVTVQVQDTNWSGFSNRLKTDPPDLYWMAWVADYNDPDNFLREIFHSGSQYNYGGFANSEFDQLVDRAKDSNDPAERQELYIHAERILCEIDAAVIPIYHAK
jgi:TolB protein